MPFYWACAKYCKNTAVATETVGNRQNASWNIAPTAPQRPLLLVDQSVIACKMANWNRISLRERANRANGQANSISIDSSAVDRAFGSIERPHLACRDGRHRQSLYSERAMVVFCLRQHRWHRVAGNPHVEHRSRRDVDPGRRGERPDRLF